MTTMKVEPELTRELLEAAQAVRLLKVLCRGTDCPVQVFYSEEREAAWMVAVCGHLFNAATLLEALEMANPFLESFGK